LREQKFFNSLPYTLAIQKFTLTCSGNQLNIISLLPAKPYLVFSAVVQHSPLSSSSFLVFCPILSCETGWGFHKRVCWFCYSIPDATICVLNFSSNSSSALTFKGLSNKYLKWVFLRSTSKLKLHSVLPVEAATKNAPCVGAEAFHFSRAINWWPQVRFVFLFFSVHFSNELFLSYSMLSHVNFPFPLCSES